MEVVDSLEASELVNPKPGRKRMRSTNHGEGEAMWQALGEVSGH